jgi:ribonuclease VapC
MTADLVVLDASALLALLFNEPGADIVAARLATSVIGAVNLSEVAAKLADHGMPAEAIALTFREFDLDVRAFDVDQARIAGALRGSTRALGLSLGDRACLALAASLNATAMTADRVWGQISADGVAVQLIR